MHYRHINIAKNIQKFTPEAKDVAESFQYWSVSILSLGGDGSDCELCGQKHLVYCYSAVHKSNSRRFFNVGSSCVKRFKNFSLYDENGETVNHANKDKVFAKAERKWKQGLSRPFTTENEKPPSLKRRERSVNSPSFVLNSTNPSVIQNAIDSVLLLAKDPAISNNERVEKCRRFFADLSRTDGYAFSQTVRIEARKQYKLLTK